MPASFSRTLMHAAATVNGYGFNMNVTKAGLMLRHWCFCRAILTACQRLTRALFPMADLKHRVQVIQRSRDLYRLPQQMACVYAGVRAVPIPPWRISISIRLSRLADVPLVIT